MLIPTARERAAKDMSGKSASFYESLFTSHSDCQINQRTSQTTRLMKEFKK